MDSYIIIPILVIVLFIIIYLYSFDELSVDAIVNDINSKLSNKPVESSTSTGFCSKGEKECRRVLEEIYGKSFTKVRPKWLKNPETGRNLELDCYNEELKIAVEYNGEQHYKWPNFTKQSQEDFIQQVRRDKYKKE